MYIQTNDPVRDSYAWEREQESRAKECPCCAQCGEPITDYYAYFFDGDWFCSDCVETHRKEVVL